MSSTWPNGRTTECALANHAPRIRNTLGARIIAPMHVHRAVRAHRMANTLGARCALAGQAMANRLQRTRTRTLRTRNALPNVLNMHNVARATHHYITV